jgi:FtsP/CotA-like multicopper oxidase with cupredoxin domain
MKRTILSSLVLGPALLLAALLIPGAAAAAGPITSAACAPGATPATVTCSLWAETGTLALPGSSVPAWGFATTSGGSPTVPGPVLVVNEGDTVTVNLVNHLAVPTSIVFDGQAMVPDQTGVAAGGSTSYTFVASAPGTYLYEAGLIPGSEYQVAMGMYGVLVVRSATAGQAFDDPATAFDDEALVVLGEVDPALNNSATPATFDLRYFAPKYSLINGVAYSSTAPAINATAGNKLLLRYANAGIQHHSIGALGLRQSVIAADGSPIAYQRNMVAETIAPGQTADVLVSLPSTTAASTKYALYDASLTLNNSTASGLGGMLAFIDAAPSGTSTGDTVGPITSAVTMTETTPGSGIYTLTATASDSTTGGANVAAAEYRIDAPSAAPTAMTAVDGTFDAVGEAVTSAAGAIVTTSWTSGTHTIYVRGQDALGNWGAFSSTSVNLDKTGPTTSALVLNPSRTNGSVDVALSATADDTTTGNSNVTAAEYFIDVATPTAGSGVAMTLNTTAPVVSLTATIPAATVFALGDGAHTISVHSRDALGNWGAAYAAITLTVDKTGPATSSVAAAPNPSNGKIGQSSSNPAVRITASFDDTLSGGSPIAAAEGFIDTAGANGAGFPFAATDGVFNAVSETGYADIPLTTINALSAGIHTIYVHGKDSVGNWGATGTVGLVIDKTGPTTSGLGLTPGAANGQAVAISAAADDVATGNSNITAGEYFIDTAGADGSGTALSVGAAAPSTTLGGTIPAATVAALTAGNHTIYVHARDAAGNWGPRVSTTLLIDRTTPTFSGIALAPNSVVAGTASVGMTVNGANDPLVGGLASGVVGGEWWIGTTNITAGTGTAFTGLTATVTTGTLNPGTYTVRVRIRDAAGNWSTGTNGVRTATLTVTPPDAAFSDGFESGNTSAWSSTSGATSVTAPAAMVGAYGLAVAGNATNRVQYNFGTAANPATATYDARFYFRPNGNTSTGKDILAAATSSGFGTIDFRVRYRLNGATPQVQIQVGAANANTTWTNILGGTSSNVIEVIWQSGSTLQLYVNGTLSQTLTASTGSVGAVRMGSVTATGNATLMYFDAFASKRSVSPLVGP